MSNWEKVESDIESGPAGLFKWIAIGVILCVILFGGIRMITKPASMAVERIVMKQSFQYKEGMAQRGAILEANIAEIDARLQSNPENREDLNSQRMILMAQLKAITINQ